MNKNLLACVVCASLMLSGCAMANETERVLGAVAGGVLGSTVGAGDGRTAAIVVGSVLGYRYGDKIFGQEQGRYNAPPRTVREYCERRVPERYWNNRGTRRSWIRGCEQRLEEEQERIENRAYEDGYGEGRRHR